MIQISQPSLLLSLRNESEANAGHWQTFRNECLHTMWRDIADIASEALEVRGYLEITGDTQDELESIRSQVWYRTMREVACIERCAIRQAQHYAGRIDALSLMWRDIFKECGVHQKTGAGVSFTLRLFTTNTDGVPHSTRTPLILRDGDNANNSPTSTPKGTYGD